MPAHKHGKQTELIPFQEIQEKVAKVSRELSVEALSFFWLLYYTGVRKSEAYERTADDCEIVPDKFFRIDFHQRKKHSASTPPLEIPLWFPGVDLLCAQLERSRKHTSRKLIEKLTGGSRSTKYVRAHWLFPHVHRAWALEIVKRILGKQYYPHFLRLNRITELCENPEANLEMIKSFSGIKTIRIIEENYFGVSKRQQDKAVGWMAKQIKPEQQQEKQ